MASSVTARTSWQRGFTMVELLVVLAIAGILLTLIGPFTINQLDNIKRAQEREKIRLLLNQWQFQAFQQHRAFRLHLSGQHLSVYGVEAIKYNARQPFIDNLKEQHNRQDALGYDTFKYSEFPQQSIHINAHGFVTPTQVRLRQGRREFTLSLENLGTVANQQGGPHVYL